VRVRDGAGNISTPDWDSVVLDRGAPQVVTPSESLVEGSVLSGSATVRVDYESVDSLSPIAAYELGQSKNGGASYSSVGGLDTSGAITRSLPIGTANYVFRSKAIDSAGNASTYGYGDTFQLIRTQESGRAVTYAGTWKVLRSASASGSKYRQSSKVGATASFQFTGRQVAWVARLGPSSGKAEIRIDGQVVRVIDLYAAKAGWRRLVFASDELTPGQHSLHISVLGLKNPKSTGTAVSVDSFVVMR
jgi:hypothetical protein